MGKVISANLVLLPEDSQVVHLEKIASGIPELSPLPSDLIPEESSQKPGDSEAHSAASHCTDS